MRAMARRAFGGRVHILDQRVDAAARPAAYEDLLDAPIADMPAADGRPPVRSYSGWEFDHGPNRRFYLKGLRWFLRAARIGDVKSLTAYAQRALATVHETGWTDFAPGDAHWDSLSYNQLRACRSQQPVFLQKAALILLACEHALADHGADALKAQMYKHMKVLPAVYRIDLFDRAFIREAESAAPGFIGDLSAATGQPALFFKDLADGRPATLGTVRTSLSAMRTLLADTASLRARLGHLQICGLPIGANRKAASEHERLTLG